MKTISNPGSARILRAPFRILRNGLAWEKPPGIFPHLLAFLLALLPFSSQAQDAPPKVGFLRFVNAVAPGQGNTHVKIGGEEMFPKGYTLGQRTGGIGLNAGSHKIAVTRQGVEPGDTDVAIVTGETVTLVAFAEKLPAGDDKPERWAIKILRLKQRNAAGGYQLTVLGVCGEQEVPFLIGLEGQKKETPYSVKRLMTTTIDLGQQAGDVSVRLRDAKEPLTYFRPDSRGNYVVILYDDEDGSVKAVSFYDPKFVIAG